MRRFEYSLIVVIAALCARLAAPTGQLSAQVVRGTVRDAIANRPIRDAVVQLVSIDAGARQARTTRSDSLGQYEFSNVSPGRYLIGFIHPVLDSLGVPPLANELRMETETKVVDLGTPEPNRLRAAFCGAAADSGAVVAGVLRDARHDAVAGATIVAEWMELTLAGAGHTVTRVVRRATTSLPNGWYFVCNVPTAGSVFLSAARTNDSTDAVELAIPADRLAHRDLYIGKSETARASGVVTGPDNRPVANAVVRVASAETHTNERGEWTLVDAPGGTRTVEFRAIGYYPQRVSVDLIDDAPAMRVSLPTMAAMLDTVRIRAARKSLARASGFDERRRSTSGHFFTAEDVTRIAPMTTSDLFRRVPGVILDRSSLDTFLSGTVGGPHQLTMPGTFMARCSPSVFVDGMYLGDLDADDIDAFVPPSDIAGMEVYTRPPLPQQFEQGNFDALGPHGVRKDPCGAIAIWTNPTQGPRMGWRSLAGKALGASALVALATFLSFR